MPRLVKIGDHVIDAEAVRRATLDGSAVWLWMKDDGPLNPTKLAFPDASAATRALDLLVAGPPAPTPTPLIPDVAALLTPRQRAADALYRACKALRNAVHRGSGHSAAMNLADDALAAADGGTGV